MSCTPQDRKILQKRESLRLFVYDDKTGERWAKGKKVYGSLTCGYGHVCTMAEAVFYANGFAVEVAEKLFDQDYAEAEAVVDKFKFPFPENKPWLRRACVMIAFNAGSAPFAKTPGKYLKAGDWLNAAAALMEYVCDQTKAVSRGLVRRRTREVLYFLTGQYPTFEA